MRVREIQITQVVESCIECPDCSGIPSEETGGEISGVGYTCGALRDEPEIPWDMVDVGIPQFCPYAVETAHG